ncbi:uncharacterized protein LOC123381382 [Prionailurus iriomotensis]
MWDDTEDQSVAKFPWPLEQRKWYIFWNQSFAVFNLESPSDFGFPMK